MWGGAEFMIIFTITEIKNLELDVFYYLVRQPFL